MSTVNSTVVSCPPLQRMLNEGFFLCPTSVIPRIALFPFLLSAENRSGLDLMVSMRPGKKRTVELVYGQYISASEVGTKSGCAKTCEAETERGNLSTEYEITCGGFIIEGKFDPTLWMDSCQDNMAWANDQILKMIAALDAKNSQSVVSQVQSLIGEWPTNVYDTTGRELIVQTQKATTGDPDPNAYAEIDMALTLQGNCRPTLLASGQDLWKYQRLMEAGCCSNSGIDLQAILDLYGKATVYDQHVAETMGENSAIAIQSGAIQLLSLNHNNNGFSDINGINVTAGNGIYFETIVTSPFTGARYDLTIKYDCGVVHVILESNITAVGMPLDMWPSGETMEGVTYVNQITVDNP